MLLCPWEEYRMDSQIESDLRRLREEEELHAKAREQLQIWSAREQQHRLRIGALLQLIATRAAQTGDVIPEDLNAKAATIGLALPMMPRTMASPADSAPKQTQAVQQTEARADAELRTDNKTAFVRKLIEQSGTTGVTPADIKRAAAARQLQVHHNFPYTILFKLKSDEIVKEERGRYFAVAKT